MLIRLTLKLNRLLLILLCLIVFFTAHAQTSKTEVLWDNYGVPHIYGNTTKEMYYAFGWCQMHSHANLILSLYAQARGRAAEYYGKQFLNGDKEVLLFNLEQQAKNSYSQQDKEYKGYLDAFVKGMNSYANAHADEIEKENKQVLPVTAYDVLAHVERVLYLIFLGGNDIGNAMQLAGAGSNAMAIAHW